MSLGPEELRDLQRRYDDQRSNYEMLSDRVLARCLEYRWQHPKAVRMVFSREPKLKTLDSITKKIEEIRKANPLANPPFRFQDVADIAALTILCAYASDIPPFLAWLRSSFNVKPDTDNGAYREYPSGHRAYHFVVRLQASQLISNPRLNLPCELQVKTILQEAFDAKSHDLAYKPGHLEVGEELHEQFSIVSTALNAVDRQSEFLKTLIVQEEQDLNLRKAACLELYFQNYGNIPAEVGLDPKCLPTDTLVVFTALNAKAELSLTSQFCKFAVFCALKLDSDFLKIKTSEWVNQFVEVNATVPHAFGVRGSIEWALGHYDQAFQDMERIITWNDQNPPDADRVIRAKNNLVYYICDRRLFKQHVSDEWSMKAQQYVQDLRRDKPSEADTIGLFNVLWGESEEEIEDGRQLLRLAKKRRAEENSAGEIYDAFYSLHEHVALTRLLKLSKKKIISQRKLGIQSV